MQAEHVDCRLQSLLSQKKYLLICFMKKINQLFSV